MPQPSPPDVHNHKGAEEQTRRLDSQITPIILQIAWRRKIGFYNSFTMPAFPFSITAFTGIKHGRGRNKYSMCSNNPMLSMKGFFFFLQRKFRRVRKKKKESAQPFSSPRCFCNIYSVHCCGHITQGRCRARQTTVSSSDRRRVRSQICSERDPKTSVCRSGSGADCVRQSVTSASFPIMAAALLPGPSSPLLFFGKRELRRQKRQREGLTQRRPRTTAAGRRAAASTSLLHTRRFLAPSQLFLHLF